MPAGRPSAYSKEIADEILERMASGQPLARICADDHMPSYTTVRAWQDKHSDFLEHSTRAKRDGTHYLADDCLRISDDMTLDPAHKRIMIDTRLRLIGKWNNRVYGDKIEIDQTSTVTIKDERSKIEAEVDALLGHSPSKPQGNGAVH